jgi:hypothetical protein
MGTMKRFIPFVLLLFAGMDAFAQGSAPSPPHLWRKKGTADTAYIVIKTGDTVMVYDTAHFTKIDIRGANTSWLLPDSIVGTTMRLTDRVLAPTTQVGINGGGGALVFDNFASSATFYSLIGNGLEESGGYLTVTIGASVEGSEITNQTITKSDIDTTAAMVYASMYLGTSASSDSAVKSKYYIDHNLFGYTVSGTPSGGQVPVYDAGTGGWTFGSGGSGSGDDVQFDMTLGNSDYVLGATTYTGGYINTSTVWQRGDTGIDLVKSGQHPGDTILHRIDFARVQRNDGSRDIRVFRDSVGDDTLLIMQDSAAFTKMTTSNASGWKFEAPIHMTGDIVFDDLSKQITGLNGMEGSRDGYGLAIDDSAYLALQTAWTDRRVVIGSSSNWTLWSDTLRGTGSGSKIFDVGRLTVDTLNAAREKMQAGKFGIITSTDTAAMFTRDTTNDTTTVQVIGKLKLTADAGLTEFDSAAYHGRIRMYDGTNKSRIDSASSVSADTLKTLPGGFLTLQGATSGRTRIKGNASAITSYDLILPAAQGSASQTLVNDGAGALSWSSAGGGGNGSADVDSTDDLDSNIWKGAGGTILLDVHKNSTPSVVIGKGATMTSLIIGGNNSGVVAMDTSALIYNNLYFGNQVNKGTRIDSTFVMKQIKENRYYFTPTDFYGSPEAYAVRYVFTAWNEADTTGTFPNSMYKRNALFYARDTNGVNTLPYNFTWVAPSRDSLFSTVYNIKTGFTQADSSSLYAAALYVNETKVDTLTPQKAVTSFTVDSLNWTDRAIAQGDVVTVLLWLRMEPTAASKKRVDIKDMYLNMRRY